MFLFLGTEIKLKAIKQDQPLLNVLVIEQGQSSLSMAYTIVMITEFKASHISKALLPVDTNYASFIQFTTVNYFTLKWSISTQYTYSVQISNCCTSNNFSSFSVKLNFNVFKFTRVTQYYSKKVQQRLLQPTTVRLRLNIRSCVRLKSIELT